MMRRRGSGVHQCTGTFEVLQRAARSSAPLRLAHPFSRVLLLYWLSKRHVALFAENPISAFRD